MSELDDLDRTVARWFDTQSGPVATADVLDGVLRTTASRRPRPRVVAAFGSHWIGGSVGPVAGGAPLARTGVRLAVAMLLLALALILAAGALLVGGARFRSAPALGAGELVLDFQSWRQGDTIEREEVAVYADGRVIWQPVVDGRVIYLEQRLTREGVDWLSSKAVATGLFERDLVLGVDLDGGSMDVRRHDGFVTTGWGRTSEDVSDLTSQKDRFVEATAAQAQALTELAAFFRDPTAWRLPPEMYEQADMAPYVPTRFIVGYDRARPDLASVPSPARGIVTKDLEPALSGGCESISTDQAREVVDALVRAGAIAPIADLGAGFYFDLGPSNVHFRPALPHEIGCS